ncbi:uncharacterized protein LOC126749702 [Anthonomus grandis grandis]|uniref:uncharacterized protein LOC126749702 n=1 Tax=Anthonomus grandis grandis TaxID=2921223 RepID=UPI00216656C4|nr:uncharacterized protein LOC126749702 [Anthonomus grandis grandis]
MHGKQEKGRKTWDARAMGLAVNAVRSKEMGYIKASKIYKVPGSTLVDYVKSDKPIEVLTATKLGRRPALSNEIENLLVTYCLDMEKQFYGLRASDIRRLAFQLAIQNGLQHPFSMTKSSAGKKWQKGFLKRHPELSFRKPQGVSAARIKGASLIAEIKLNPARLFNVDETGITTVQHKHSKVLSLRGKRQVGALTTSERGALVTVVTCMSATEIYVPPVY